MDAAGGAFAFEQDARAEVLLQVADARRAEFGFAGDGAEQAIFVAERAGGNIGGAEGTCGIDVVDDDAEQLVFADVAGGVVELVFQAGDAGGARVGKQDDIGIERTGDLPVHFVGVRHVGGFQQTFHDDDIGVTLRGFEILDDGFHQFVEIARVQRLLHGFRADGEAVIGSGARGMAQDAAAVVDFLPLDVVLDDGFVEADFDALAVKGVIKAEDGGSQADALTGGNDQDCFCHGGSP
ncbi:hypothetical protein HMPREF9080_00222 [Cardiobacterium valvarum F0432]|uniref:Uncharacterized protein n=1 Tax=Cardiobacterium valvarum F0432 TaxID=797473 RepID=G9ZBU5_9GAMM|nr:hypothetical protein HMPREF9080_00222 [Cardiobacterium valvarum F0432]